MAQLGYLPNQTSLKLQEGRKVLAGMEADAVRVEANEQMAISMALCYNAHFQEGSGHRVQHHESSFSL